jgi:hypothetical protein
MLQVMSNEKVYYIEQWGNKFNPKDVNHTLYFDTASLIDGMVYTNLKSQLQTHAYFRVKLKPQPSPSTLNS